MSDERFFSQVKSTMFDYAPAVADHVYHSMRRKFWWNKFTTLSATRFNMWYLLLMVAAGGAIAVNYYGSTALANMPAQSNSPEFVVIPLSSKGDSEVAICIADASFKPCCSAKNEMATANCCSKSNIDTGKQSQSANTREIIEAVKGSIVTASADGNNSSMANTQSEDKADVMLDESHNTAGKPRGTKALKVNVPVPTPEIKK